MTSPARAHKQSVLAGKNADIDLSAAEPYQRLQYQLAQDRRTLSGIKGIADKIAAKRQMIDKYRDWLNEVHESGKAQATDTVFTIAPESPVTLSGFKSEIDAESWVGVEVSHTLDSGGLISKIRLESLIDFDITLYDGEVSPNFAAAFSKH